MGGLRVVPEPAHVWMKKEAVADYLGVSPRTIDNWRRDLGLPSWTISRVVRFDQAEVDAWVAAQQTRGYGPAA